MHAMRIARAFTGRDKIVKFEGQYHGVHDYALISVGPNDMSELGDEENPVALRWGRGIPDAVAETIIPARYNNIDFLRRLFERQGEEIAAIIVEPVLGNAQGIMPKPGFHQAMRALTEEFGILLIFDEVKTGFRFAKGGAAEFFGITPGPRDLRQGDGQRLPGRGVRRARGGHGRAARQGQPRRDVRGQPRGGRRGRQDARDPPRHRRAGDDPRHRLRDPGRRPRRRSTPRASPYHLTGHPSMFGIMFTEEVATRVPRLGQHRPRPVRRDRHRHAGSRRDARARQPRAVVRVRGARGRGHGRPHHLHLRGVARRRARGPGSR